MHGQPHIRCIYLIRCYILGSKNYMFRPVVAIIRFYHSTHSRLFYTIREAACLLRRSQHQLKLQATTTNTPCKRSFFVFRPRLLTHGTQFILWIIQGAAFNVTNFKNRITHLLYTAINTTEHGQVGQCLRFTKSLTSSIQRLGDVLHDNQGNVAISQVHLP